MVSNSAELDDVPDYTWKVILVGNKKVGKTSISTRYVEDTFDDDYNVTTQVKYKRKNVAIQNAKQVAQLHIWDTLGQEKFKSLAPLFFRRSVAALLVYDVTDRDSFLAIDSWYKQIRDNTQESIVVMLVGNKIDKPDKVITHEMGAEFARANGWGFIEVSAKEDLNVKQAFAQLTQNIYNVVSVGNA